MEQKGNLGIGVSAGAMWSLILKYMQKFNTEMNEGYQKLAHDGYKAANDAVVDMGSFGIDEATSAEDAAKKNALGDFIGAGVGLGMTGGMIFGGLMGGKDSSLDDKIGKLSKTKADIDTDAEHETTVAGTADSATTLNADQNKALEDLKKGNTANFDSLDEESKRRVLAHIRADKPTQAEISAALEKRKSALKEEKTKATESTRGFRFQIFQSLASVSGTIGNGIGSELSCGYQADQLYAGTNKNIVESANNVSNQMISSAQQKINDNNQDFSQLCGVQFQAV